MIRVKLKELLEEREMSQNSLAEKAEIRRAALSALHREGRKNINLVHLEKIMRELNLDSFDKILEIVPDKEIDSE